MRDDDDILAPFQFHDDGLQADDYIAVGFTTTVAVVVFVVIAGFEILRVTVGDFLVGEAVAHTAVELVEGFPFELVVAFRGAGEEASRLDGTFESGGPDGELTVVADRGGYEVGKGSGIEFAALGDVGVAANFAFEVEFGFAMLRRSQ